MEKKVFINIEDSHSGHDDSYSSQTSTQGVLRLLENGYELSYEEPAAEMEGCVTTLLIEGGELLLNYTIDVNADLAASNELKITVSGQ